MYSCKISWKYTQLAWISKRIIIFFSLLSNIVYTIFPVIFKNQSVSHTLFLRSSLYIIFLEIRTRTKCWIIESLSIISHCYFSLIIHVTLREEHIRPCVLHICIYCLTHLKQFTTTATTTTRDIIHWLEIISLPSLLQFMRCCFCSLLLPWRHERKKKEENKYMHGRQRKGNITDDRKA